MIVVELELLDNVSSIAREMNLSYSYKPFNWEGSSCCEIISSNRPFLAVVRKRLKDRSNIMEYFLDLK